MSEPIKVLLDAARTAASTHGFSSPSVLRGAPSHTGAYLLQALEEQGWTLAPKMPEPVTIYASGNGAVQVLGYGTVGAWLEELGLASVQVVPVASDESQDPSRDLANVNEAYRLEREDNTRLRELLGEVAVSGVSFDDERVGYLEVQIDRTTWREILALEGGEGRG